MKTCTLLGRSLLLVVMLAVSWAAAVPQPDDSSEEELQGFLNSNPFTPYPFNHHAFHPYYPYHPYQPYQPYQPGHPYYGRSQHVIVVDPYSMVSFLANNERWADEDSSDESDEDEHDRKKRQATFGLGMNRGPYGRDYHASAGYNRHFNNGRSSLGVHGHRNWGASGKSHGFGISFSHRFRR